MPEHKKAASKPPTQFLYSLFSCPDFLSFARCAPAMSSIAASVIFEQSVTTRSEVLCGAGGHARCVQVASAAWPAGWALVPAGSEQVMPAAVLDCAYMTGLVPQARCHKPDGAVPARCAWQPLRQQQLCELGSAKNERVVTMNRLHGLHR